MRSADIIDNLRPEEPGSFLASKAAIHGLRHRGPLLAMVLMGSACFSLPSLAAEYGKVTSAKVAEGVYLFQTTPYGDVGLGGNAVAILSDEGVVMFDTSGTPASGTAILAEVHKLTNRPVLYVINSHWHWDHWGGNQVFKAAYPNAQFLSHAKTREQMIHVAVPWNAPGLERDLPQYVDQLRHKLQSMEANHLPENDLIRHRELIAADEDFLQQKRSVTYTFPNTTFAERLTLYMGGREIQVLHARAITPGDTYVYLPHEKMLLTGDILVSPIPFAIGGSFPQDWIDTLKRLDTMDVDIIIPGHGDVEHDRTYLRQNLALFLHVLGDVRQARAKGMTVERVQDQMKANARVYAADLSLPDGLLPRFVTYFLGVFAKRAFFELEGPLGDSPTS